MGELNASAHALTVDELDDAVEAGDVVVFVDAKVIGRNSAFREDGGGFEHDESSSALRTAAEMDHMPIVGEAVVGGVLAHGRDSDAVGKGD